MTYDLSNNRVLKLVSETHNVRTLVAKPIQKMIKFDRDAEDFFFNPDGEQKIFLGNIDVYLYSDFGSQEPDAEPDTVNIRVAGVDLQTALLDLNAISTGDQIYKTGILSGREIRLSHNNLGATDAYVVFNGWEVTYEQ